MSFPYINAFQQFFDTSGSPLVSGTIEFRDPTTNDLINSYPTASDADAQTNANANPLTLNASGAAATGLFLEDGVAYKVILKDAAGATVKSDDNVKCPVVHAWSVQTTDESTASITPSDYSYPPGDVRRYGAVGDGTTDDTTAIQNAITVAEAANELTYEGGGRVHIPAGTYHIASTLNLAKSKLCQIVGDGQLLSSLSYTGSGVAIDLAGTASGDNQSFYMADLQISNDATAGSLAGDGTGTTGFEGNFMGFSPTFERVLIKGFITYNWYLENFENGLMNQTRSEGTSKTKTGVYLKNANNVTLLSHQGHGPGARSGNDPTNTAHASYTGSVEVYADNIEGCNFIGCSLEGAATDTDVGLWLEEPADRATPRGGPNITGCYFERIDTAIVLRGFDSDTELRNVTISGGKISGGVNRGIIGSNYVYNVSIDNIEIQADAGKHWLFDSTCKDIHIGRCSYQNDATGGNSSAFPGIHNGMNFMDVASAGEGTTSVYTVSNLTGTSSLFDYTPAVIAADYRRIRAVILNVKITVNTSGSSGRAFVSLVPKGEGDDSKIFFTIDSSAVAQTTPYTEQYIVPVDGTNGAITYQAGVTASVSWDIDVDITQVGVLV